VTTQQDLLAHEVLDRTHMIQQMVQLLSDHQLMNNDDVLYHLVRVVEEAVAELYQYAGTLGGTPDPYREAVEDLAVINWVNIEGLEPREALRAVLEADQRIALDPQVSEAARELVARGAKEPMELLLRLHHDPLRSIGLVGQTYEPSTHTTVDADTEEHKPDCVGCAIDALLAGQKAGE
jgi:hypothetical protein